MFFVINRCLSLPLGVGVYILLRENRRLSHGEAEENFFPSLSFENWLNFNVLEISMIAAPHTMQVRCRSADWEKSHRKEHYCLSYITYSSPEIQIKSNFDVSSSTWMILIQRQSRMTPFRVTAYWIEILMNPAHRSQAQAAQELCRAAETQQQCCALQSLNSCPFSIAACWFHKGILECKCQRYTIVYQYHL